VTSPCGPCGALRRGGPQALTQVAHPEPEAVVSGWGEAMRVPAPELRRWRAEAGPRPKATGPLTRGTEARAPQWVTGTRRPGDALGGGERGSPSSMISLTGQARRAEALAPHGRGGAFGVRHDDDSPFASTCTTRSRGARGIIGGSIRPRAASARGVRRLRSPGTRQNEDASMSQPRRCITGAALGVGLWLTAGALPASAQEQPPNPFAATWANSPGRRSSGTRMRRVSRHRPRSDGRPELSRMAPGFRPGAAMSNHLRGDIRGRPPTR
jgi:hypothetical protein